jgi:hypothetical protein
MDETQPLVGDVKSQFLLNDTEHMSRQIEAARLDQEAMCGYPLVLKGTRTHEFLDEKDRRVIEVFATFGPTPEAIAQEAAENAATKVELEASLAASQARRLVAGDGA